MNDLTGNLEAVNATVPREVKAVHVQAYPGMGEGFPYVRHLDGWRNPFNYHFMSSRAMDNDYRNGRVTIDAPVVVEVAEVEAPVKAATRSGESLAHEAVEAYRQGALPNLREFQAGFSVAEWRSVGRRLVAYGCPVLGKGLDAETRLANFAYDCLNGCPILHPTTPPVLTRYPLDNLIARKVAELEASVEPTPDPVKPVCGGSPQAIATPLDGIAANPPLMGMAPTRKMTASDYDVNLDDIRKEGWDLRYFTIAQRAIRDGALEVLASSDYGCSVHGPGLDTYGDTDDEEQVDFMAWLRVIRSPIRLTARNFSQAWDEFIVDCREGTPVGFPVTPLPDDDLDAMRSIFEETIHPDATENARWSASSSSRMTTDSDGTSRCEIPTESYSGDRPRRATEDARLSIPSDTGSSVRRPPSGAATTDTRKTPSDATIDPEETLVDIPMEGDYGYCWGDDDTRLVGDSVDHDHHDPDGYYSPWMRPAYEPMELDDYEAMLALGLAF